MSRFISNLPSALYRKQIAHLSVRMHDLVTQTMLHPLRSMAAFHKAEKDFAEAEDEAYLCCSVMDTASIHNEERADNATTALMQEMIHLKNDASDLIENEPNETLVKRHLAPAE